MSSPMPDSNPDAPHTDFVLPGWVTSPLSRQTSLSSLAAAYSRKWNPRNLEYLWYEPWTQILQALVADLPSLSVAPQSYLWYYRNPRPGDHHIEPPFVAQDEDNWFEEADTTLDSIDSIHVGNRRNKYQLVDFAITRKVSRNRAAPARPVAIPARTSDDKFYLSKKVEYVGIPVLCELKRGAPRTTSFRASLGHARAQLGFASAQLVRQAHHLFEMYPHQEEVLLLAVAGFWWSYCILPRKESKIATPLEIEEAEQAEASTEPDAREAGEIPTDLQDGLVDMIVGPDLVRDEQDQPSLPSTYHGLENVTFRDRMSEEHLIITQSDFRLSFVTDAWSLPLLFDTPPSNQVLYLIHQRLETIVNDDYDGTKG